MLNSLDHYKTTISTSASQQTIHTLQSETGIKTTNKMSSKYKRSNAEIVPTDPSQKDVMYMGG